MLSCLFSLLDKQFALEHIVHAAQAAGLSASSIPALLVEGDDKPGLGYAISASLSEAGINIDFLIGQVIGRKYSTVIGFETDEQSRKAVPLIKKAAAGRRK
jgi:predicted amino acid-binding ACT domain protein